MKIVGIFAVLKYKLLSVKFDGNDSDEYDLCFTNWQDPEYLEKFFEENKNDLENFWGQISVEEAVEITMNDAFELEKYILEVAIKGSFNKKNSLGDIVFYPLFKNDFSISHQKTKSYGIRKKTWLRLYAIRVTSELFVICGSAIKLTKKIQDREHTMLQLTKLEATKTFLKEIGLFSDEDYQFIEFGNYED